MVGESSVHSFTRRTFICGVCTDFVCGDDRERARSLVYSSLPSKYVCMYVCMHVCTVEWCRIRTGMEGVGERKRGGGVYTFYACHY